MAHLRTTRLQVVLACFPLLIATMILMDIILPTMDPETVAFQSLAHLISERARDLVAEFNPESYALLAQMLAIWDRKYEHQRITSRFYREVQRSRLLAVLAQNKFLDDMRQEFDHLLDRFRRAREDASGPRLTSLEQGRADWDSTYGWFLWAASPEFQLHVRRELAQLDRFLAQSRK